MCIPCFFTISTAEVGVVERWGKFSRLVQPGLNCVICPMEQVCENILGRAWQSCTFFALPLQWIPHLKRDPASSFPLSLACWSHVVPSTTA